MIFSSQSVVLAVFFRKPSPGTGKRRLAATLGQTAALEVSEILLSAVLEDAAAWPGPVVLSPAHTGDAEWAQGLMSKAIVMPQSEGNLGERVDAVCTAIRQNGGKKIIVIGSDSPALTSGDLVYAAKALEDYDTVLLPALDGGVTLMAARCAWPNLAKLPWGTGGLGAALVEACKANGLDSNIMPMGHDIDTEQDLRIAANLLRDDSRPGRRALRNWINEHIPPTSGTSAAARISVIVPVYDDDQALAGLLNMLDGLSPPVTETIVVDGKQSTTCEILCQSHGATYISCEAKRGVQLGKGARFSQGEVLWFLHADAKPPRNAVAAIRRHLASGFDSGYFRFRFDTDGHWGIRLLQLAINLRARLGVPYGDQGLFVRSETYFEGGGHCNSPLFEEVKLIRFLRSRGRCLPVHESIGVSTRRWERDGWIRRTLHNRFLALAFAAGVSPEKLAKNYNDGKNKS